MQLAEIILFSTTNESDGDGNNGDEDENNGDGNGDEDENNGNGNGDENNGNGNGDGDENDGDEDENNGNGNGDEDDDENGDENDWVENGDDCDDTNPELYPTAPCQNEEGCTGAIDASCTCVIVDSDLDGVCDTLDKCVDGDDTIDKNQNGVPDCLEEIVCTYESRELTFTSLKSNTKASKEIVFDTPINNPHFIIFSIDAKEGKYSDLCTVSWTDKDGNVSEPMVMTPD